MAYTLYFDGRDAPAPAQLGGAAAELSGHWRKKDFEVVRTLRNGETISERYQIEKQGQRLVIHVKVQGDRGQDIVPEYKMVYDRYAEQAAGGS